QSLPRRQSGSRRTRGARLADDVCQQRRAARALRERGHRRGSLDGAAGGGTIMRVFVAGASGTIGVPLVKALVAAGPHVTAMRRTPSKQAGLMALGATPVVADALDAAAVRRVVVDARPTHVIHQLTALPKDGPKRTADLVATNRLRDEGTRHLLAAAVD